MTNERDSVAEPSAHRAAAGRSALVPSPSAYLAQAKHAVGALPGAAKPDVVVPAPSRPAYRPHDPALRLWSDVRLPHEPDEFLDAMVVRFAGAVDGGDERLLYDLGYSSIRPVAEFDAKSGTSYLIFVRRERAAVYARLAATLRYINRSPAPSPGPRRIAIETLDPSGRLAAAAAIEVDIGSARASSAARRAMLTIGEAVRFSAAARFLLFWSPHRLRAEPARVAREPRADASYVAAARDSADDGAFSARAGSGYRLFEAGLERRTVRDERRADARRRAPVRRGRDGNVLRFADLFGSEMPQNLGPRLAVKRRAR